MEIVVVFAGKFAQARAVRNVGEEAYSCLYEEFYALQITQMRGSKGDEAVEMLREADI